MDSLLLSEIRDYAKSAVNEFSNPLHTWEHFERVGNNAVWLVKTLNLENFLDLNLVKASCYLHDIPINIPKKYIFGPIGKHLFEKKFISKYLPDILNKFKIEKEDREILFEAIYNHSFSIPYRRLNKKKNLYIKILQDSDSLDYFSYEREKSLKMTRKKSLYYLILFSVSKQYFVFGRKNIHFFLNFSKVAQKYIYKDEK